MFLPVRHADSLESLPHHSAPLRTRNVPVGERQFHVLEHREIANQVKCLKDETDLAVAYTCALRPVEIVDRPAIQLVPPIRRRIEQAQNRKERRFSAA